MERSPRESMPGWKFCPPRRIAGAVSRPDLVGRLQSSASVALIAAPAGWGKSTLLAEWLAAPSDHAVAFAALDQLDDSPRGFWTTLIDALVGSDVDAGIRVPASPQAGGSPIWPAVVPPIIDELVRRPAPVTMVLDDYHVISDPQVHEGLRYLIDHLPRRHRLCVASRVEPPLRIARLRAAGELTEIRSADLALDDAAVGEVVQSVARIDLADSSVTQLRRVTEGWPAAVYLAALSMRTADSPDSFVADLTTS